MQIVLNCHTQLTHPMPRFPESRHQNRSFTPRSCFRVFCLMRPPLALLLLPPGVCPTCPDATLSFGLHFRLCGHGGSRHLPVIDGSGSTQATDFQVEMKTSLSEVAGMFNIASPEGVRVGAVQYARPLGTWNSEISKYTNKHDVGKAIENESGRWAGTGTRRRLELHPGAAAEGKRQRGRQGALLPTSLC